MRVIEPWVAAPLQGFLDESGARLTLLMTSAGQVIAQDGFTRSVDVMAAAALGAAIMRVDRCARRRDGHGRRSAWCCTRGRSRA